MGAVLQGQSVRRCKPGEKGAESRWGSAGLLHRSHAEGWGTAHRGEGSEQLSCHKAKLPESLVLF